MIEFGSFQFLLFVRYVLHTEVIMIGERNGGIERFTSLWLFGWGAKPPDAPIIQSFAFIHFFYLAWFILRLNIKMDESKYNLT